MDENKKLATLLLVEYKNLIKILQRDINLLEDENKFYLYYELHFVYKGTRLITPVEFRKLIDKIKLYHEFYYLNTAKTTYRFLVYDTKYFYKENLELLKRFLIYNEDVFSIKYFQSDNRVIKLTIKVMKPTTMQNTWYHRVGDFLDLFYSYRIGSIHVLNRYEVFKPSVKK